MLNMMTGHSALRRAATQAAAVARPATLRASGMLLSAWGVRRLWGMLTRRLLQLPVNNVVAAFHTALPNGAKMLAIAAIGLLGIVRSSDVSFGSRSGSGLIPRGKEH